jgi:hypothetical protein
MRAIMLSAVAFVAAAPLGGSLRADESVTIKEQGGKDSVTVKEREKTEGVVRERRDNEDVIIKEREAHPRSDGDKVIIKEK